MIDLNGNSVAVEKTESRRFDEEEQETQLAFANGFVKAVTEAMSDIYNRAYFIGFRLDEANRYKYYEALGYASIADLAEAEFGFKRSTTYGLMQAFNYAKSETPFYIADEYKGYSYTALLEMSKAKRIKWLNKSHGIEKILTPKVSVSKIKEVRPLWDKWVTEHGNLPNCKSVDEFLELVKEQEPPAPSPLLELAAESEPTLPQASEENPVQSTGLAESKEPNEPEETEELTATEPVEEIEELSESNYYDGEDYSQYDEPAKRSKSEIIKVGLTGVDIYVEDAKFQIVDRYRNEPLKGDFSQFIKSVYNYGNKTEFTHGFYSKQDNMNRTYDDEGVQFICFDPYQKVRLTWEEVAHHISELIYTDEYFTELEQEQFVQWKAEQDGLIVNVAKPAQDSVKLALETGKKTNWEYLQSCTRQADFLYVMAQGINCMPEGFGEGMPDRIYKWLQIWLEKPVAL